MKVAKTISDVSQLLLDYGVEIQLTDDKAIYFNFPDTKEEKQHTALMESSPRPDDFSHLSDADSVKFSRKTIYSIRSLAESPRFWRLTTVADQLGNFSLVNTDFGKLKVRKKANQPLTMLFETQKQSQKFFHKIRKLGNWVEVS